MILATEEAVYLNVEPSREHAWTPFWSDGNKALGNLRFAFKVSAQALALEPIKHDNKTMENIYIT